MSMTNTGGTVTLTAQHVSGDRFVHKLEAEQSVLIGSSPNCGLRLDGDGLSPCHCLISLEQGTLWVQDWASKQGTLVNGEAIAVKTAVTAGDRLHVGPYHIAAVFDVGKASPSRPIAASPKIAAADDDDPVVRFDGSQPPGRSLAELADEEVDDDGDSWLPLDADDRSATRPAPWYDGDSFEQETIQLLRAEVEELQGVVAQRDAQIAELTAADTGSCGSAHHPASDGDQSDALLTRMDQLLEEAACSDERVAVLEEMLHAAEQAQQAEQEERAQLEAWVDDIERRIGQRDEHRNAELDAARARLTACEAERDRAQRQLQRAAESGSAAKCYEETLDRLQQQNHDLQAKLDAALAERRTLAERLDSGETRHDQTLREERAAIAQERALVSRLRSELTSKLASLEELPERAEQPDRELAIRLRTLREHLREIHLQEQRQRPEGLSSRIARLWKRVEP